MYSILSTEIASAIFFPAIYKYGGGIVCLFALISFAILFFRKDTLQKSTGNNLWHFENETQREALLRTLLENSYHGLAQIENGIIVNVDTYFASLFEFEPEELIGKPISEIISRERVQDNESPILETVGKTANGEILYIEILQSSIPITNARNQIIAVRDITERKKAEEKLKQLALYDPVTNLYNRAHFLKHITSHQISPRKHMQTSLFFIDLDNFKAINDHYGHEKGDEILKAVGERLVKALRDKDIVARYGGDEFVIACDYSFDNTYAIAQRILLAMQSSFPLNGISIYITASIGAVHNILDYPDIDSALRAADKAMYYAKNEGRNQFAFAPHMDQNSIKQKSELSNQSLLSLTIDYKPERRLSI